jgi:hypothetical protein
MGTSHRTIKFGSNATCRVSLTFDITASRTTGAVMFAAYGTRDQKRNASSITMHLGLLSQRCNMRNLVIEMSAARTSKTGLRCPSG